ncbi:hypothetical protein M5585_22595 [Serratia ureilytica]
MYNQELIEDGLYVIEIPPVNGRIPPNPYEHEGTAPKEMQAFHEEWAEQRRREWRERGGVEASEPPARGIDTELSS